MELLERHFDSALETPDGVKKLRELILTLAMQGKLVPQDPKDQPASELLKEIEEEKKSLVKTGKIKKQELLPQIKPEEIPYEVPEGWEWARLGNVGLFERGKSKHRPRDDHRLFSNGTYPLVQTGDVSQSKKNNFNIVTCGSFYNDFGLAQSRLWKQGTLCVTIAANIAETGFLGMDACFPDSVVAFSSLANVSSWYVKFFIDVAKSDLEHFAPSTAQKNINLGIINELAFPLPPLAEQKRIVAKIDQLMSLCDKLEAQRNERNNKRITIHTAAINKLLTTPDKMEFNTSWSFITKNFNELYSVPENVEELKKAILQLAVMGKLVPQDPEDRPASELLKKIEAEKKRLVKEGKIKKQNDLNRITEEEIPFSLPKEWHWVRFNDVFDVRDGTHDTPKYVSKGIPLVTSKNIYTGKLDFSNISFISEEDHLKIKERSNVEIDDILFAMIGSIGNPVIVDTDEEFSIKNVALFKYYNKFLTNAVYLHYYLLYAQEHMKKVSSGAVQNFVSLGFLRSYLFPLPPLTEQKRIVSKIDQLMSLCNEVELQLKNSTDKQIELLNAVLAKI